MATAEASESELGTTVVGVVVGFVANGVVMSFSSSIGSVIAFVPEKKKERRRRLVTNLKPLSIPKKKKPKLLSFVNKSFLSTIYRARWGGERER